MSSLDNLGKFIEGMEGWDKELKARKRKRIIYLSVSAVVGITSFVSFGIFTNWPAAIALFFALWANNIQISGR